MEVENRIKILEEALEKAVRMMQEDRETLSRMAARITTLEASIHNATNQIQHLELDSNASRDLHTYMMEAAAEPGDNTPATGESIHDRMAELARQRRGRGGSE
jgi:DNA-binding protein H-NS